MMYININYIVRKFKYAMVQLKTMHSACLTILIFVYMFVYRFSTHQALINIILMIFLWVQTSIEMYLMRGARGHPSLNIYRALKFMLKFVKSR